MNEFFDFDLKMREEKIKQNILETYRDKQTVQMAVIPTFEILFKEQSGFGVYACEDADGNAFNIKGEFISQMVIGQTYLIDGTVITYKGEKQLRVNRMRHTKPVNKRGIISYLQTLKGLKSKAELIYEAFGDESIDILMEEPMRVASQVHGIGKKSVMSWKEQLEKMKDSQQTISTLLGYGLSITQSRKLYERFKDEIVVRIEENPYFLSLEVRGYGFEKCDRIARSIGFDPRSKFRIQEGIIHVLEEASREGHCFLPLEVLIEKTIHLLTIRLTHQEMNQLVLAHKAEAEFDYQMGEQKYRIVYNELRKQLDFYNRERSVRKKDPHRYVLVAIGEDEVGEQLQEVSLQRRIIYDNGRIYLRHLYEDELIVATRIQVLSNETPFTHSIELEKELDEYIAEGKIELEEKQREAVLAFAKAKGGFYVLNGSAGCGKTFTLKIILAILREQYKKNGSKFSVRVFAPTGKASKVATKATGIDCVTVHRGLGYNPQTGFNYNEDNPLEADVIVLDESSMLDITLAKHLLTAIQAGTKIIFLGDTKQLPSVGAGNVLKDLIESGIVQVVTLDVVKRQGKLSGIIRNANRIIAGQNIESCDDTKDAYVLYRETSEGTQKAIMQSISRILTFEGYTLEDIQVLCPQRTGLVGTYMMNYLIQQEFNPETEGIKVLNHKFQVTIDPKKGQQTLELFFKKGDKVIHIKNNYDMEWYVKGNFSDYVRDEKTIGITNGECGVIEEIVRVKDKNGDELTRIIVRYEDKFVFYDDSFDELDHAFSLTTHKSQGSQWKAVILPIMKQHYMMLDNNLFYTGYTRAEQFNVVIGQKQAILHAIETHKSRERYTHLDERIRENAA